MPSLEWRVNDLTQDASEMFEEVFEQLSLLHLRAFAVWRSDDVPVFYWCAEEWVTRVERRPAHERDRTIGAVAQIK